MKYCALCFPVGGHFYPGADQKKGEIKMMFLTLYFCPIGEHLLLVYPVSRERNGLFHPWTNSKPPKGKDDFARPKILNE